MQQQNISSAVEAGGTSRFNTTLPVGTITLLLGDIEGSTRLLQQLGDDYAELLSEYRSLLRAVCQQWNGSEVDMQGDAFFTVFVITTDAVLAALAIQRALAAHSWPNGVSVRVRMGLHTGEPQRAAEGYVGLEVHQAARIMSAGHGGQVLLSQTTHDMVAHNLPKGVDLQDLGKHRLKDLQQPGQLYQLVSADLPAKFPPLKTLDATSHNLPAQPTALIGREKEVAAVKQLLQREDVHLLTLTGPGGVGKTHLALSIATALLNDFPGGVSFVSLAPVRDPEYVIPTIAKVLDVQESADQPLLKRLTTALAGKHLLLLDNFEQVMSAAPLLSALLESCPSLKMLVTSREALRVRGEREIEVHPLALPDLKRLPSTDILSVVPAVELFMQRAQAIKADFQLTPDNAQVIAQICTRLDGLPLALELAVARIKLLSPQALLARLEHRLHVLTRGSREVAERQQTLYNTLQWSYDLLSHEEQRLFRSLGVFSDGWTLPATQAVCTVDGKGTLDVEDGLASLIDKSLVRQRMQADGELRFSLLETIRDFALHCLEKNGEVEMIQHAHAAYYLALAEQIEPQLDGPQQTERFAELEREYDNLRATLQWVLEQANLEQTENELALRFCLALRRFWIVRCYWREGRTFLERALAASKGIRSVARARALWAVAGLATHLDDYQQAEAFARASLELSRQLGDTSGISRALYTLGAIASNRSDYPVAHSLAEEALALARTGSDQVRIATLLVHLGEIVTMQGDYTRAQALFEESLQIQKELGNKEGIAMSLFSSTWGLIVSQGNLEKAQTRLEESLALARELDDKDKIVDCLIYSAHLAIAQDALPLGRSLLEESLVLAREIGDLWAIAEIHCTLAKVAFVQGDHSAARALCEESLQGSKEIGSKELLASGLERLAEIVTAQSEAAWAAQLWGAAETLRESMGAPITPLEHPLYCRMVTEARTQLGEEAFVAALVQGRSMSPEQALAPADSAMIPPLEALSAPPPPASPSHSYPAGLTQREVEVLRLLVRGFTNPQIADQLIVSPHTVKTHVRSILSKLGVTSRNAIIHFAFEHHLV